MREQPGTVLCVLEQTGDLWQLRSADPRAWVAVTTNGTVRPNRELVMGAGVAGQAARLMPGLAAQLGDLVAVHGNVPVPVPELRLLTYPTKPGRHVLADRSAHDGWMCQSRVRTSACEREVARLVWHSAHLLVELVGALSLAGPVLLPRPGCGLGGLSWDKVRPALAGVLDDRFVVVTLGQSS